MAAPIGKLGKAGRAVVIRGKGGPEVLHLKKEWYCAAPEHGEVMLHVVATSVNPVDTYMRSGAVRQQFFPKVLGSDVAGVVVQAGAGSQFAVNDKLFALTDGYLGGADARGTYAEYVRIKDDWAARVPEELPLRLAGGMPLVALTAWQALAAPGALRPGGRMLILGASGGVGHIVTQLAKARGLKVIAACGAGSAAAMRDEFGAHETFDYARGADALRDEYGGGDEAKKIDYVLDLVGGPLVCAAAQCLKPGGHLIHVVNRGDDAAFIERTRKACDTSGGATFKWHDIFVRPSGAQLAELAALFADGTLRLRVAATMPLEQAAEAHRLVESGHAGGKVILKVS